MVRLLTLSTLCSLGACADPAPETTPFEGPGFDATTGLIEPVDGPLIVALTQLDVHNAPGPGKRFGAYAQSIGDYLYGSDPAIPGFVGGSFRNVGKLHWWTMTVWRDEASMMDFVLSEPHVLAMGEISELAARARSTHTEISTDDLPYEWDVALDVLEPLDWKFGRAP